MADAGLPLTPWLHHLEKHLPIARQGQDPEGVHQVRVAGRRLRVWLELAGLRVLQDDLAWLVQCAGRVRDLEVLLQHPDLSPSFRRWAQEELKQARQAFVPLLNSSRLAGLLAALATLPPLVRSVAQARLERLEERVGRRASIWEQTGQLEHLHALRRALRRLRYAREWLELETKAIKALQESFGQVGDLAFTLAYLQAFETGGGRASRYRQQLKARLTLALEEAQYLWHKQKHQLGLPGRG
ncbi:CHAD domain-containing protein [Meiothermus rufus]|uniref:CHAD domain-containing protein n=1 Tax=Meiothermus rufus TaxID=604332 RepID=UPI000424B104|nr:CHAD domain-containing protein [Meiothermus rufus]